MAYVKQAALNFQDSKHLSPRPYQRKAVQAIVKTLQTHDRCQVVMACGSGKTLVGLWAAEALNPQQIVVFVPSLALIQQFLDHWLSQTRWQNVTCLAVCSDESVVRRSDRWVVTLEECRFPVTTEPKVIRQFLKKPYSGVKWVFCTYQSAHVLSDAMQGLKAFELGVFDEAHRTCGNNHFGLALQDNHIPIQKRLFMTTTPKHFDVRHLNQDGEARLLYSMDNEVVYGPRAYTLSFRKAVELGVIVDYKILISVVKRNIQDIENNLEAKVVALSKVLEAEYPIQKVITFHGHIEEAFQFKNHLKAGQLAPHFLPLHVSGCMPMQERTRIMQSFREKKAVITNARCLTEGVDVPAVDMVAFFHRKKSKIDIVQAIGRAMRISPKKTTGYILLPIFLNEQEKDLESAINEINFNEVWDVVQALKEQDEELCATINAVRQSKGEGTVEVSSLKKYLEIILTDSVDLKLQSRIKEIIFFKVLEKVSSTWYEQYGRLKIFKKQQGHCNVPQRYQKDKVLGSWVANQRHNYKQGLLSSEKIDLLKSISFEWKRQ